MSLVEDLVGANDTGTSPEFICFLTLTRAKKLGPNSNQFHKRSLPAVECKNNQQYLVTRWLLKYILMYIVHYRIEFLFFLGNIRIVYY